MFTAIEDYSTGHVKQPVLVGYGICSNCNARTRTARAQHADTRTAAAAARAS